MKKRIGIPRDFHVWIDPRITAKQGIYFERRMSERRCVVVGRAEVLFKVPRRVRKLFRQVLGYLKAERGLR